MLLLWHYWLNKIDVFSCLVVRWVMESHASCFTVNGVVVINIKSPLSLSIKGLRMNTAPKRWVVKTLSLTQNNTEAFFLKAINEHSEHTGPSPSLFFPSFPHPSYPYQLIWQSMHSKTVPSKMLTSLWKMFDFVVVYPVTLFNNKCDNIVLTIQSSKSNIKSWICLPTMKIL